jgi:hypothetical protein
MDIKESEPLSKLSRELQAFTGKPAPGYRALYNHVLDGRLPAEQVNGRWYWHRIDLPAIAAALGLAAPIDPASKPAKHRKPAARPLSSAAA